MAGARQISVVRFQERKSRVHAGSEPSAGGGDRVRPQLGTPKAERLWRPTTAALCGLSALALVITAYGLVWLSASQQLGASSSMSSGLPLRGFGTISPRVAYLSHLRLLGSLREVKAVHTRSPPSHRQVLHPHAQALGGIWARCGKVVRRTLREGRSTVQPSL